MEIVFKEVQIRNFKSLKNLEVSLDKFNVIVGRNGAGKTNFIEFFKFLKSALAEEKRPYMPYMDWWSYRNIVWMGKTELPISATLRLDILGHDVTYEVQFSVIGGVFNIVYERLAIDEIISMEREGQILRVKHDEKFLSKNAKRIERLLKESERIRPREREEKITSKDLLEHIITLPADFSNLTNLMEHGFGADIGIKSGLSISTFEFARPKRGYFSIVFPFRRPRSKSSSEEDEESEGLPFPMRLFFGDLEEAIEHFTILRHPSITDVKRPTTPRKEEVLSEDSSNLHNILYYWFLEKGGKLPERIEKALLELLPDIQIRPTLTSDGKVYIKMFERGVELDPPCIPDGVYKLLAILAAIELKPTLLAIDEIENSLYAEALEYVIDELRNSKTTVIVATHSPVVVDMVKFEELLIAERTVEGTLLKRIEEPEKLRKKLMEIGVTQSESWIYGKLGE